MNLNTGIDTNDKEKLADYLVLVITHYCSFVEYVVAPNESKLRDFKDYDLATLSMDSVTEIFDEIETRENNVHKFTISELKEKLLLLIGNFLILIKFIGKVFLYKSGYDLREATSIEEIIRISQSLHKLLDAVEYKKGFDIVFDKASIERKIQESEDLKSLVKLKPIEKPQHSHIFTNNGFKLFEFLLNEDAPEINKRGRAITIHYYYHQLKEHKYIIVNHTEFINWFNDTFNEVIIGTKTKEESSSNRRTDTNFNNLIKLFQANQ
jgi:hypothetical protein